MQGPTLALTLPLWGLGQVIQPLYSECRGGGRSGPSAVGAAPLAAVTTGHTAGRRCPFCGELEVALGQIGATSFESYVHCL